MKFSCDQCNAQYMIADEKVGTRGVKVKCKKCGHVIVVKPTAAASVQAGPAAEPRATDGFTSQTGGGFTSSPFNEPTQAMSASQLETLKAAAATSEASVARAAASLPVRSGRLKTSSVTTPAKLSIRNAVTRSRSSAGTWVNDA